MNTSPISNVSPTPYDSPRVVRIGTANQLLQRQVTGGFKDRGAKKPAIAAKAKKPQKPAGSAKPKKAAK